MAERDHELVIEVADRHGGEEPEAVSTPKIKSDVITLKSGVVVRTVAVSAMAFGDLETKFPPPPVPKTYDEVKGREILNPLHPDYKKAVAENESRKAMAALDLVVVLGTKLVSVPAGSAGPDDEEWIDRMFALGYSERMIASKTSRYLAWIKLFAITDNEDWETLSLAVMRRMGVPEPDVNAALKSFPNQPE